MPFSQPTGEAQTQAVCQFCEKSKEIKWKCINCGLFLCQLCCSIIHSKIKTSTAHEILNLDFDKEGLAASMRKVDIKKIVCTKHSEHKCVVYCNECRVPACSDCLMEPHKLRDYKPLDEVYNYINSEMKELRDNFETYLEFFRKEKDKLQRMLSDGDTDFQETRNIILQTEKEMKEAISKYAKDLLQELDSNWKPSENMIKTELSVLTKNVDELETRNDSLNQVLQSHQAADIFSTSKTLDKSLPQYSVKNIKGYKKKFIPCNLQVKIGRKMFGEIYRTPDLEFVNTFESDVKTVTKILVNSDNTAFIGSMTSQKLQLVKFQSHNINVERDHQIKVCDMVKTPEGDILVSTGESDLKLYSKRGQLLTFKSFSPLKNLCVHVTKDNKIIGGLTESFPVTLPATEDCIRRLVIMNENGDIHHTIEYDRDNKRMLTYPHRINTLNDKIIVIDYQENEKRVIMLDQGGQLHWTYNGLNHLKSERVRFYPRNVTITSLNMILVADIENHEIHVLNPDGEVIVCRDLKRLLGIECPSSLDIDKNEVLWIGCNTFSTDKNGKAKINCVRLI